MALVLRICLRCKRTFYQSTDSPHLALRVCRRCRRSRTL